jgi:hypothetical protein
MDDAILKSTLEQARGRHHAPGACLNDDESALFVAAAMDADDRARAVAHIAACDDCLERIVAITELEREQAPASAPGPALARAMTLLTAPAVARFPIRHRMPLAAAASLMVMLLGALVLDNPSWLPGQPDGGYRELRSGPGAASVPGLLAPRDAETLPRAAVRFAWTPVEDSLFYEVELLAANGDMLWQERSEALQSAPPQTLFLDPEQLHYVWVRAYLRDGKTVKSQSVSFRVMKAN